MTSRPQRTNPRTAPRLFLVTPRIEEPAEFSGALAAALAGADVAAVWLRLAEADERTWINRAKALASFAQDKGAAVLLDGMPELVARAGADGAHLTGIEALAAALDALKPGRIAGVGGLASRHDAMLAAEAGADYVMFGEPDDGGGRPAFAAVEERVAWWAEVFESPCVGFAATLDETAALAAAGADFVAVGDLIWNDARGPGVMAAAAAGRLALPERIA
jgi:thiamine-phosphate pyrophosphorylase